MPVIPPLQTGQSTCYDAAGERVPCSGTGQDAEFRRGIAWPTPRFAIQERMALDRLTGLFWPLNATLAEFPLTWDEALAFVADMNRDKALGHDDWRLPNRRELRSLLSHHDTRPALPADHPFHNVFPGWYWSSTSAAISPSHAWYVHMDGARMFYGGKDQSYLVWPVRGQSRMLAATGQTRCFDGRGREVPCAGTGQDGERRNGIPLPAGRFGAGEGALVDRLTGLSWMAAPGITGEPVTWETALALAGEMRRRDGRAWRLPNINELESLVDCDRAAQALPAEAAVSSAAEGFWSSTTSTFETDWAWALYAAKGAVGVGQKRGRHFHVWLVRDSRVK